LGHEVDKRIAGWRELLFLKLFVTSNSSNKVMQLDHKKHMAVAVAEAQKGIQEGGIPIGSVLVDANTGAILAQGHNQRVC
jgi:hypothetical protein